MQTKPKLCLNMIVKDEAHVIKETLENIYKYIDYYVINDTGSTDNTKEIIKEFFDSKGIKGEVISHEFRSCKCHSGPWKRYSFFHFGWNRSYALQQCLGKSEYIWVIDADDLVVGNLILPELSTDAYTLTYGKGFTYKRTQIFKNDSALNWHYVGALHEYPNSDKKNYTKQDINGDYHIDSRRLGARNKDPQKYLRDAKVFEELLLEDPTNSRDMFYCGQSWFDYGEFNNSIKWYKKRIEMKGWYEEVFYSYYRVGQAMERLQMPWKDVEQAYLDAFNYCKIRAEPLYNIILHYRAANDYQTAHKYAKKASVIAYPDKCVLFIYKDFYDYKILDELAVTAFHLGKYHEAHSTIKKIIESNMVPENDLKRIKQNLVNCENKLAEQKKQSCCIYTGNELINQDSVLIKLITLLAKYYKIIIAGNRIDQTCFNDIMVCHPSDIKTLNTTMNLDYLILFDSINYYYGDLKLQTTQVILLQSDISIKYKLENDINILYYNNEYLNTIFNALNINKIVCTDTKTRNKLANEYKLQTENVIDINLDDETTIFKIFDDSKIQYNFKQINNSNSNGIIYQEPKGIKFIHENINLYNFSKNLLVNIYTEIINKFPKMPEPYHFLASLYMEFNDFSNANNNLDNALKLINNKNKSYKDSLLLAKAKILTKLNKHEESYNMADDVLSRNLIPEQHRQEAEDIRDINVDVIKDTFLFYSQNKINKIVNNLKTKTNKAIKILFSITTCKRYDLFEKTMNSFINCCSDIDLIDHWLCVDDNSSYEDRNKMKKQYPFLNFVLKDESQKGHYISMNMIRNYAIKNNVEYILHIEDDWHFVQKLNHITNSLKILNEDKKIGQVLFNRNYGEVEMYKRRSGGGFPRKTKEGLRYIIHEYYKTDTKEYNDFMNRHKNVGTCGYWPHFSFRPSLMCVSVLNEIGPYYNTAHFEMQYAIEYYTRGYVSAFLDTFCCIHTGKKTWEHDGQNSYFLNKTGQFTLTNETLSINILSDTNDINTWKEFKENAKDKLPFYLRHIPRNVSNLNDAEKALFINNNFNYLRTVINSIMVHIDLFSKNNSKYLVLLREDIDLSDDFKINFDKLVARINSNEHEVILLDEQYIVKDNKDLTISEQTIKLNNFESLHGYIISQNAIKKILNYLAISRIKDIDYLTNLKNLKMYSINKKLYTNQNKDKNISKPSFIPLEGYKFYSQLDSYGNDIGYFGDKTPEELKEICEKNNGKCFNTLGFIKHSVTNEKDFIYLPNSIASDAGLYVKI
jgi:hypothetical protein